MLRCQFLCYDFKTLFFVKIALKLSYFCKKMQNFQALGAPPPDPVPPAAGVFAPAPIGLRRLEAPPQDPKIIPPHCEFLATRLVPFFGEDLFFGLHLNSGEKSVPFLVKTFFFALDLICSPEKNRG